MPENNVCSVVTGDKAFGMSTRLDLLLCCRNVFAFFFSPSVAIKTSVTEL